MQLYNQYLNQFPATDQQIIKELMRQYESGDPQSRALAQRRLEPYTQQLLQMSTADRMQRRQDAFQAGPAMPEESMSFQVKQPAVTPLESDPAAVIQQAQNPDLNRDLTVQSRMNPQQLIGTGVPSKNPTTLGQRFPLENRPKLPPMRLPAQAGGSLLSEPENATVPQIPGAPPMGKLPAVNPPQPTSPKTEFGIPNLFSAGLLDEEQDSAPSLFNDPTRMGLLQAGLGLMSAPQYSTNPNDVSLTNALAKGVGGFIQGYGTTSQRLKEEERQELEDEYRRSEREFNQMFKGVMMDDARSRMDERNEGYTDRIMRLAEEKNQIEGMVNEILVAEGKTDNKTRKINLTTLARQDRDRFNELHQNSTTDRTPFEQILIKSGEYDAESAAGLPLSILKDTAKTIAAQRVKQEKPEGGLFGDSLQAKAAQYLIDEQGADPQQLAERIMEGRSTPQVVSVPVDPNDPTKGSRLMLLDRNNLAMDEIPGGTTVPPKKEINATDIRNYNDYQITLNQIDQSIGLLKDEEAIKGVGDIQGYFPGVVIPAKAKQLRALMADLTSDRLNEKFGAALTKQEFDRIKAAVPLETDSEETLQVKLNTLKDIFQNKLGLLEQQYPSSRYRPFPNINAVGLDGYNEAIGN